jgi:hypothetical protein
MKGVEAKTLENRKEDPADHLTIRTRGQSPLKKHDVIGLDIREPNET